MDAQTKISRAIIKLVANHTFYGTCALRLTVKETTDYKTMCTDGRSILWNREFVDECSEEEVRGTIAHEVWHVILGHHFRMGKREHKKWNIATDFSINNSLKEEGFILPPGALMDDKYIFKHPIHENINFNIQSASKSWCLDLYEIEKLMNKQKSNEK